MPSSSWAIFLAHATSAISMIRRHSGFVIRHTRSAAKQFAALAGNFRLYTDFDFFGGITSSLEARAKRCDQTSPVP
jgi:hypothetical protein